MRLLLSLMSFFAFFTTGFAQQTISMSVDNCAMSASNEIQFDISVTNNGPASVGFNSAVIRLTHNAGILPAGGAVTWGFVTGSAPNYPLSFPPSSNITFDYRAASRELSVTLLTNVYLNGNTCSAPQIGAGVTKKIGRFYLRNTLPWVIGQQVGFAWSTTSGAVLYVNCASTVSNFNTVENRILSAPCSLTTCAVTTSVTSVSTCSSYTWLGGNGSTYTESGTYVYTHTNGSGCLFADTLHLTINSCSSLVNLNMFLQGYYAGSNLMQPVLSNQGIGNSMVNVDSVTIDLRSSGYPYTLVATATGMLHTDGTVSVTYPALNGTYYIAVRYKNAIETWSAAPVNITAGITNYNFTSAASKAFGSNMVEVETGVWAVYTGDIINDQNIDISDYSIWESDYNELNSGYYSTDLNGDGNVDISDYSIWESNYNNLVSALLP